MSIQPPLSTSELHLGWFELGNTLQSRYQFHDAIDCYRRALAISSENAGIHNNLGAALLALADFDAAAESFGRAVDLRPTWADAHNNLGVAYKNLGRTDEALACYREAIALRPDYAQALFNIGTLHYNRKEYDDAVKWYGAALEIEPNQVEANQNMAAMLLEAGYIEAAKEHRERAYRRRSVFIETAPDPVRSVLLLWSATRGNIPIEFILPKQRNTRVTWMVEYPVTTEIPPCDVVLNAIGDHDAMGGAEAPMRAFLASCRIPVLNQPDRVARTARERLADTLSGIAGVHVPRTLKLAPDAIQASLAALPADAFPILLRPSGSHGGSHLVRIDTAADVATVELWPADDYYLTDYRDFRSADGHFRKYRIIFVDRRPLAYHLAIGDRWMVHYETAGMLDDAAKRAEEQQFLENPTAAIGPSAMAAIEAIGRALDLDYCGIDFSILPDGRVLVFEANATMLVHPETTEMLDYKNPHVRNIVNAFDAHLTRCTHSRGGKA